MILRLHRDEKGRLVFSMENDAPRPLLTSEEHHWVLKHVEEALKPDVISMLAKKKGYRGSLKKPNSGRRSRKNR